MGVRLELLAHLGDRAEEVGTGAVHLVDERDAGNAVLVGLAPDRLGLGLHAGNRAEHGDRAVEHAQRALHLGGEVNVSRSINDVDTLLDALPRAAGSVPSAGNGGGGDRDATLALLLHPIGHGRPLVHLAHLVDGARIEKDALGRRRLARIDVRGNSDVPGPLQRERPIRRVHRSKLGLFSDDLEIGGSGHGIATNCITSGGGRRHGWPAPSCACLPSSSQPSQCCCRHRRSPRRAHRASARPCGCRRR